MEDGRAADPVEIRLTAIAPGDTAKVELAGIGATLAAQRDVLVVGRVVEGGGAAEAGIAPGDEILAIDATSVSTMDFNSALQRIRGPVGTTVALLVRRSDHGEQTVTVIRRLVQAPAAPQP